MNLSSSIENLNVWVLKAVLDQDRSMQTVESYQDRYDMYYNYDTKVPNHRQVVKGDFAIIINKKQILGLAKVVDILSSEGTKIISRCPECGSSTIDLRKHLHPRFRCNNGHAFAEPSRKEVSVTRFTALFGDTFVNLLERPVPLSSLREFYLNGYNQNMSIQRVHPESLQQFSDSHQEIPDTVRPTLLATEGCSDFVPEYAPTFLDERISIIRAIRARRGQQKFREALQAYYGESCQVSGCEILPVLEAAHILPYRSENDNHVTNGLLLRADIHTLFDLNLIGIEPRELVIHIHPDVMSGYGHFNGRKLLCKEDHRPNLICLSNRWNEFLRSN